MKSDNFSKALEYYNYENRNHNCSTCSSLFSSGKNKKYLSFFDKFPKQENIFFENECMILYKYKKPSKYINISKELRDNLTNSSKNLFFQGVSYIHTRYSPSSYFLHRRVQFILLSRCYRVYLENFVKFDNDTAVMYMELKNGLMNAISSPGYKFKHPHVNVRQSIPIYGIPDSIRYRNNDSFPYFLHRMLNECYNNYMKVKNRVYLKFYFRGFSVYKAEIETE